MRHRVIPIVAIATAFLHAACSTPPEVDALWSGRAPQSAQEIIALYDSIEQAIGSGDEALHTKNLCHYVWSSGEYIFECRGKNSDITQLAAHTKSLALDDGTVEAFMVARDTARFADHYMTLDAMKRGATFEQARDGLTITVFYKAKAIGECDYQKLRTVFSSTNAPLHEAYMRKMLFPFRNSGCTEELYGIRPLIEKNVADSPLKQRILSLYDSYKGIMPGAEAPDATLWDAAGKSYTLSQYRGKVLVIDVWATWCSSCIAHMPQFMELRSEYKANKDIEFITVSIDRRKARKAWMTTIERRKMQQMTNLYPDCDEQSLFETAYHISGVPRYIIIDQEGKIVTAYAPSDNNEIRRIISQTLNK